MAQIIKVLLSANATTVLGIRDAISTFMVLYDPQINKHICEVSLHGLYLDLNHSLNAT